MKCLSYTKINYQIVIFFLLLFTNELLVAWGCPSSCICRDVVVDCSGKDMKFLPKDLPIQTSTLRLDNNKFTDFPDLSILPNLEIFSISGNSLSSINSTFISTLKKLKDLNLSHNKLTSIPHETFDFINVLENLDLSYNLLQSINGLSVSFPLLQKLNVQQNKLVDIDVIRNNELPNLEIIKAGHNEINDLVIKYPSWLITVRKPFPKLKVLELNNNQIKHIRYYLKRFQRLKKIVLSHNLLESITLYSFIKNDDLEELYLDHNQLTIVTNEWFVFNTKLKNLDLSYNQIHNIDVSAFKGAMKIKYIDLSNNNLGSIDTGMFLYLQNLTYLNLHNNHIDYVAEYSFFAMDNLLYLNLSSNDISIGEKEFDTAFKPLKSLKILDLNNNKVLLIPAGSFFGLKGLETLYLKGNNIKYIEKDSFKNLESVTSLYLETDSLDCDCSIKWFRNWLNSKKSMKSSIKGTCTSPDWLKNQNMMNILDTELTCVKQDISHTIRPKIVVSPQSTYGYLNGNVTLDCVATSSVDTLLIIVWYRGNKILQDKRTINSPQQLVGSNLYRRSSTLVLQNIQFEEKGKYWCNVNNIYGSDWSLSANMTVVVPPVMSPNLQKQITVRSGQDVLIPCSAEGIPTPVVHFTKRTGDSFHAVLEKRIFFRDNMFGIQNLKIEDSGLYACIAKSAAGVANATIGLIVIEKPTFIRPMKSKEIALGTTAVLDCIISGNPRPKISWFKDGVMLHKSAHVKLTNQMLVITTFEEQDEGLYSCHATNRLGSAAQSSKLSIGEPASDTGNSGLSTSICIAIIVVTIVVVVVITSLVWVVFICYCRRRRRENSFHKAKDITQILAYKDEAIIPELPKNYLLRCNGKLVSAPKEIEKSDEVDGNDDEVVLNDNLTAPLLEEALNYLKEQQGSILAAYREANVLACTPEVDEDYDDNEHDSGVLVHYKSGSSFDEPSIPASPRDKKNRSFVTIDLTDNDHRDRRKQNTHLIYPNQLRSASFSSILQDSSLLDRKPLCMNNNSNLKQQSHHDFPHYSQRRKYNSKHNGGDEYYQTYLTSSSGIESGVSSSSETISMHEFNTGVSDPPPLQEIAIS